MRRLVALALVALAAAGCGGGKPDFIGSEPPARIELAAFALRDQDGRLVRAEALRGKAVVLTFLDTKCTESCPIIAAQMRDALAGLDAETRERVAAVAISVSPVDDTPATVREFLRRHRASRSFRYLIGSERELREVWQRFKVASALDTGSANLHSAPVRVYDTDGVWVSTLHAGADLTADALEHDVRLALG